MRRKLILGRRGENTGASKFQREQLRKEREFASQLLLKPWVLSEKAKLDYKIFVKDRCAKNIENKYVQALKIVAYTSLSPSHHNIDNQLTAIESWNKMGMDIYSFNSPEEVNLLRGSYPEYVKFVECKKSTKHLFGKPYILITDMMENFQKENKHEILMLLNSDIILNPPDDMLFRRIKCLSESGVIISSRDDFKQKHGDSAKYAFGFDVFLIHKKYINIYPPAMYSMGQTWWDYWVPYIALKNKVTLYRIEVPFAFHREHPKQYKDKDWHRMTQYFKFEHDITEANPQIVNDNIWKDIMNNSITI